MPQAAGPAREREARLVASAAAGRREAFAELVLRYEAPLQRFLRMRCGSAEDAEELAQESFLRAWKALASYDARWSFSTWLFTLARRLAASRRRSARPPAQGSEALGRFGRREDPLRSMEALESGEKLWGLAERVLTPEQKSALWLRYAEDLDAAAIGKVLGRRAGAVRVLLFRARSALARHLEPALAEAPPPPARARVTLGPILAGEVLEGRP